MGMQVLKYRDRAHLYVRSQLSKGMTLAQLALARTNFDQGQFFSWLPSTVDQDIIQNFGWTVQMEDTEDAQFAHFIHAFIHDISNAVVIQDTENWDISGYTYRSLAANYEQELYWYIRGESLSEKDILSIIGTPILPYPWCGFFYGDPLAPKSNLSKSDLELIVQNLHGIAVGAFDSDSFILWWDKRFPLPKPI